MQQMCIKPVAKHIISDSNIASAAFAHSENSFNHEDANCEIRRLICFLMLDFWHEPLKGALDDSVGSGLLYASESVRCLSANSAVSVLLTET